MGTVALAVGAHPDDIEFMMAGTLAMLRRRGAEVHMWNLTDGSLGGFGEDAGGVAAIRAAEARASAAVLGATLHPPIARDMELSFDREAQARVTSVIRDVEPAIILAPSPMDYHPDREAASRIVVAAALARALPAYRSDPPAPPWGGDLTIYHALPHGLLDPLGGKVAAGLYVDVSGLMDIKRKMLDAHDSQKPLLASTQGADPLVLMEAMATAAGADSRAFAMAEGWRRRAHTGLSRSPRDPLAELLDRGCVRGPADRGDKR